MDPWLLGLVSSFLRDEEGQGLAEYALILVLISIIAMAALNAMGLSVVGILTDVNTTLSAISSS